MSFLIGTIAGLPPGGAGFTGPSYSAIDSSGNLFVVDTGNYVIKKITPAGVVSTFAGSPGNGGYIDGTGSAARFNLITGLCIDSSDNLFVANPADDTIRKITPAGVVTTFAGSPGIRGNTNGTGAGASFFTPYGLAIDSSDNIYVSQKFDYTIRKITPAAVVTSFAGASQTPGTADGTGSTARFTLPTGLATDSSGNIFVADAFRIRKITPVGVVTTFAGSGAEGNTDGTGVAATFDEPSGIAIDGSNNLYVGQTFTVRKITSSAVVTTIAGTYPLGGNADGTGAAARFFQPVGMTLNSSGDLFVVDNMSNLIRKITPAAVVTTFAGVAGSIGNQDGTGSGARFNGPTDICVDSAGDAYVADTSNSTIRKITSITRNLGVLSGVVTTFAGTAGLPGHADGTGSAARFTYPHGIDIDSSGNLFVADTYGMMIRKITPAGVVTTFAGTGGGSGYVNGTGSAARFNEPWSLCIDSSDNIYVADRVNSVIRKITPAAVVTTLAGDPGNPGFADGTGSAARFFNPQGVAVDNSGNVFVADTVNQRIRKITPAGVVTTLAGSGVFGLQDGTLAAARFTNPIGIAVTSSGDFLAVSDYLNNVIRGISISGNLVTTEAGLAETPGSADGAGSAARFDHPTGLAFRGSDIYIADMLNNTIRGYLRSPQTITFSAIPNKVALSAPFAVSPTASSGLTVTLVSSNPAVASVSGFTITPLTAGSCTITATQNGNDEYNAAPPVSQPFTVTAAPQTITFSAIPNKVALSAPFAVSPTASSGLTVTLVSSNPAVASVSGFVITPLTAGNCTITATQSGGGAYAAASPVSQPFTVTLASQTINFSAIPSLPFNATPFQVSATASSGLTLTLISSNPSIASVSGLTITPLAVGSTNITATQNGSAAYSAATPVSQPFTVTLASQTISFPSFSPSSVLPGSAPFDASATASSGLPVILTSSNPSVASISGLTITPIDIGTTTITATQLGNATFSAATPVTQRFSVSIPSLCNEESGCDCECDTLVIGESGAQGPQGFSGVNGTNGIDGLNAFTSLTSAFTQPNEFPALANTVTISVGSSAWIALGQNIYISQAGYYEVTSINSSTSITVSLLRADLVSPASTVSSGRKISPSSAATYIDPTVTSLDINTGFSAVNPALRVSGSNTLPLIQVDAALNQVGINVTPVVGGSTMTVGGSIEITGNSFISSGYTRCPRFRTGITATSGDLTKILFSNQTTTVTLSGSVGSLTRASLTIAGVTLGDTVKVGYAISPLGSFESDVSILGMATADNTVTLFFTNFSTTAYSSTSLNLNITVLGFALAT